MIEILNRVFDFTKYPNTIEYLAKYGWDAMISTYLIPNTYKSAEELYGECLRRGVRWEDIVPKPPEDAIL